MASAPAPTPITDPSKPNIQTWPTLGLTLIHDFITPSEEATMIDAFHATSPLLSASSFKKRISQHFGYHFDYTTFGASETSFTPVPKYIEDLLPRLPVQEYLPDQFTAQYYPPGAGIPPHVDTHSMFGEALYSLSYGSAVPMVFREVDANDARKMRLPRRSLQQAEGSESKSEGGASDATKSGPATMEEPMPPEHPSWEIILPPRSLLLMMGPSRYGYTHGIKSRKTDMVNGERVERQARYSITMRSIRRGDEIRCDCSFPGVCDARIREEQAAQGLDVHPA